MNNYVLVTGGAGYIGSHTVVALSENGYCPVIADDLRNANPVVLDGLTQILGQKPILHQIDICKKEALNDLFKKYSFEGVIHFAAYKAVAESVEKPLSYYKNNLLGLINVLECVQQFGVVNFVFSSSCTVYGQAVEVKKVSETTPKQLPISPYGYTKWMGEQIISDFHHSAPRVKLINLRYFNPVGAHHSALIGELPIGLPNNLFPFIMQTAIGKRSKLTVYGNDYPTLDGTCIRDYIHVTDLAEAHLKALKFLESQTEGLLEGINIGTGTGTSVMQIINSFERITGLSLPYEIGPRREGDVVEIYADVNYAQEKLDWMARLSINEAIRDAWAWEQYLSSL